MNTIIYIVFKNTKHGKFYPGCEFYTDTNRVDSFIKILNEMELSESLWKLKLVILTMGYNTIVFLTIKLPLS